MPIRELQRYCRRGCRVEIIYMDRRGRLSQREVIILSVRNDMVKVYCFARRGVRVFIADNILAVVPKVMAS